MEMRQSNNLHKKMLGLLGMFVNIVGTMSEISLSIIGGRNLSIPRHITPKLFECQDTNK